jgi:hypothetical protein
MMNLHRRVNKSDRADYIGSPSYVNSELLDCARIVLPRVSPASPSIVLYAGVAMLSRRPMNLVPIYDRQPCSGEKTSFACPWLDASIVLVATSKAGS